MAAVFIIGCMLLGWHRTHERLRRLRRDYHSALNQNMRLHEELHRALDALTPPREPRRPVPPEYWSDDVYLKLARDITAAGVIKPKPRLAIIDREAHSHAESAHRKEPA